MIRTLHRDPRLVNLSIAVIGDHRMRQLNHQYRGYHRTTNVLSFAGRGHDIGEIVISFPQLRRQARQYRLSAFRMMELLTAHGLLHLIGYDHHRPAEQVAMMQAEELLLHNDSLLRRSLTTEERSR